MEGRGGEGIGVFVVFFRKSGLVSKSGTDASVFELSLLFKSPTQEVVDDSHDSKHED